MTSEQLTIEYQLTTLSELAFAINTKAMTRHQLKDLALIGEYISASAANRLLELPEEPTK